MKKQHFAMVAALSMPAFQAHATTLYCHTFDGVANDDSPAVQGFTNGASGATVPSLTDGLLNYSGSGAGGYNTTASIDLSMHPEFTIEFVVENNASGIVATPFNGTFFGVATNSPDANGTSGSTLYNNVGTTASPAIGLQVGNARGGPGVTEYAVDAGATTYTDIGNAFLDDATDGYSIFVTYADDGLGGTAVNIVSTGLSSDINYNATAAFAYSTFADQVTPNVSSQGGNLDLASIKITTIPEPSAAALGGIALLGLLRRRRNQ